MLGSLALGVAISPILISLLARALLVGLPEEERHEIGLEEAIRPVVEDHEIVGVVVPLENDSERFRKTCNGECVLFVLEGLVFFQACLLALLVVYRTTDHASVQVDDDFALQEIWLGFAEGVVVVLVDIVGIAEMTGFLRHVEGIRVTVTVATWVLALVDLTDLGQWLGPPIVGGSDALTWHLGHCPN